MRGIDKGLAILNWIGIIISLTFLINGLFFYNLPIYLNIFLLILTMIFIIQLVLNKCKALNTEKIVGQAKRVVAGNLNTRLTVRENGFLAELAGVFNKIIEDLQRTKDQHQTSEESRKRLLSNISHDIRTPLTSIIGYVEALKDDVAVDCEEKKEYLDIIAKKSKGLKHLTDEIFHMAKLDSDDILMDFNVYDIGEVIRECLIEFIPQINKNKINLKVDIPEEKLLIYGDKLSLIRIIDNLIKNAISYGKDGRFLGIEVISKDRVYEIRLVDRGQGISEEDIKYVFERLYIKDKARKKNYLSSGLGLAIVKKLVEKHGGEIWVESTPWVETVFTFTLPKL